MLQFLFDTDHLTLFGHRQPPVLQRYAAQPLDTMGLCSVSMEEILRGRLAPLARATSGPRRVQAFAFLVASVEMFRQFNIVAYDDASENRFQQLLALKLRIGPQYLKIAAVALTNNLTLLTRNRRDFSRVPGLVLDDWSL
jgi:tRNA(fMet)-specific endonuclease VapC